jgi:hypothetical protein
VPHAEYGALVDAEVTALVAQDGLLADLKNLYGGRSLPERVRRWTL